MESFLYSPLSIHQLAIYNCHNRTHRRRSNSRPNNCRRVHASVLAPVHDYISFLSNRFRKFSMSPVILRLWKLLHRLVPGRRCRPPKPQHIGLCQGRTKNLFLFFNLKMLFYVIGEILVSLRFISSGIELSW